MLAKRCLLQSNSIVKSKRYYSSGGSFVNLRVNDKGVAVVELNRPPVNSLNTEVLERLHQTFWDLEKDKVKGMILTSTSDKVFTAGLDINEMYESPVENVKKFWITLQDVWIKLYSAPYPTVAAINGHSPAGGCLLALSCEYRIMVPKVKIGLNETLLGIVAPFWFQDCMRNVIGERQTEKALIAGTMFSTEEALKIGLIDEIASDRDDLMKKSYTFLEQQMKLPGFCLFFLRLGHYGAHLPSMNFLCPVVLAQYSVTNRHTMARNTVKETYRAKTLNKLTSSKEKDIQAFIDLIFQPEVQESLGNYLKSLRKKISPSFHTT